MSEAPLFVIGDSEAPHPTTLSDFLAVNVEAMMLTPEEAADFARYVVWSLVFEGGYRAGGGGAGRVALCTAEGMTSHAEWVA